MIASPMALRNVSTVVPVWNYASSSNVSASEPTNPPYIEVSEERRSGRETEEREARETNAPKRSPCLGPDTSGRDPKALSCLSGCWRLPIRRFRDIGQTVKVCKYTERYTSKTTPKSGENQW